jgi:hypothetical protein
MGSSPEKRRTKPEGNSPWRQGRHRVSAGGNGALVGGACDKELIVGSSQGKSTEDHGSNAKSDGTKDDSEHESPVVAPQEPMDPQPNPERSPFVSIGGGLVALDLEIPSRPNRPAANRQAGWREVRPLNLFP